jgi:hypothetical protein
MAGLLELFPARGEGETRPELTAGEKRGRCAAANSEILPWGLAAGAGRDPKASKPHRQECLCH